MKRIFLLLSAIALLSWSKEGTLTPEGKKAEAVDLGLSVKWASFNLGASAPEEYGTYVAWGESGLKAYYMWDNYKYCNEEGLTKYNYNSDFGAVDNMDSLVPSDDAATIRWGGKWRMPTFEETEELKHSCTWEYTKQNNVNGFLVTSKVNGNTIFLPASGYRIESGIEDDGSLGYYWSSTLCYFDEEPLPYMAISLIFDPSGEFFDYVYYMARYIGMSVRPVTD